MQRFLKSLAGLIAVGLIIYGMVPWSKEEHWLPCLWIATILGGFAIWPIRTQRATGIYTATQNLALFMIIGFTMLTLQLLRTQVIRADEIYNRVVAEDDGNITSNIRLVRSTNRIKRGAIFDSQGVTLAENVIISDNRSYRTYPIANQYDMRAFGHTLGYVSSIYGLYGLESSYNEYLAGGKGNSWQNLQNQLFSRPREGNNVQLTINAQLQDRAFKALDGRVGSVVVIDVKTGAIRAMVSTPSFDPSQLTLRLDAEDYAAESDRVVNYWNSLISDESRPLVFRSTQGQYPPGSTFKTVTAIGVLNNPDVGKPEDITCPNELFPQEGVSVPVVNAVDDEAGYIAQKFGGKFGLDGVYAFSCNTAFAQYGIRLQSDGRNLLEDQARRFHIYPADELPDTGDLTDLPSAPSQLYGGEDGDDWWSQPVAIADTAYGQGRLLVTPLEMAMITQSIGNNGDMMKPYLVERVTTPQGGELYQARPRKIGDPMSVEVSQRIRISMKAVVEQGWSGATVAGVPGYSVGGKSGTAENPLGAPHAWFISLAPLEDPKYAVAVMVENGGEGTSVGGSLAGIVMSAALEINP